MLWKKQVDRAAKNLVLSEILIETDVNQERRIGTAEAGHLSERNYTFSWPYAEIFELRPT